MAEDWKRAGEFIARRRRLCRYKTQAEFAHAVDASISTIGNLENGRRDAYAPGFLETVEETLGWELGSIKRTAQGGRPREHTDPYLARIHSMWPRVQEQTKRTLVDWLERAVRD